MSLSKYQTLQPEIQEKVNMIKNIRPDFDLVDLEIYCSDRCADSWVVLEECVHAALSGRRFHWEDM